MKLPAQKSRPYFPIVDNQEWVRLMVWEGDKAKALDDEDNVLLAEWDVRLNPRPQSQARVEVEYTYNASGLLHVRAVDGVSDELLFEGDVQRMTGLDPQMLVGIAQSVGETLGHTDRDRKPRPHGRRAMLSSLRM